MTNDKPWGGRFAQRRMIFPKTELTRGARPTKSPPMTVEQVDQLKRTDCRRYQKCLDHACGEGWEGFSCTACRVDDPMSYREKEVDRQRLEGMAFVIVGERTVIPVHRRH